MTLGRTIKIYLQDGSVTGIRYAEIVNWSGQAISIPRSKMKELVQIEESKKPGIYFLFGVDENERDNHPAVYIGESESIFDRLNQHLKHKEFWNEAIFFTSKDENLTKSHIKYLEARLIEEAKKVDRYTLDNSNDATLSALPKGDRDSMEEFIDNIRILLGTMGHKTLEPIISSKDISRSNIKDINIEFTLKGAISADAIYSNEGMIVKKGSRATRFDGSSLANGRKILKQKLIDKQVLVPENEECYIFSEDYLFNSPSQAAAIILGYLVSGPQYWIKKGENITLKQYEERK